MTRPWRVVIALDSFKGSVSSQEACRAASAGVLQALPDADVVVAPIADGGEGTVAALAPHGAVGHLDCTDLLGRPVNAPHVVLPHATAVESASTVGLNLLPSTDPTTLRRSSSAGLGAQLRQLVDSGHRQLLVGLGGTGTVDGGTGLLLALGARLLDSDGTEIGLDTGNPLLRGPVRVILPELAGTEIVGLADVRAPLTGSTGAAQLFGPQKGADPPLVDELENAMVKWAQALRAASGRDVAVAPGAGAAGGLGAAILALGGTVVDGLDQIAQATGVVEALAEADLVITGEGSLDDQTELGKVPAGIARLAKREGHAIVVALAGRVSGPTPAQIDVAMPIGSEPRPLAEAMKPAVATRDITAAAARVARLLTLARG